MLVRMIMIQYVTNFDFSFIDYVSLASFQYPNSIPNDRVSNLHEYVQHLVQTENELKF